MDLDALKASKYSEAAKIREEIEAAEEKRRADAEALAKLGVSTKSAVLSNVLDTGRKVFRWLRKRQSK